MPALSRPAMLALATYLLLAAAVGEVAPLVESRMFTFVLPDGPTSTPYAAVDGALVELTAYNVMNLLHELANERARQQWNA